MTAHSATSWAAFGSEARLVLQLQRHDVEVLVGRDGELDVRVVDLVLGDVVECEHRDMVADPVTRT